MILGVAGENDEILLQVWYPAIKTRAPTQNPNLPVGCALLTRNQLESSLLSTALVVFLRTCSIKSDEIVFVKAG